jgi:hypothetical protein
VVLVLVLVRVRVRVLVRVLVLVLVLVLVGPGRLWRPETWICTAPPLPAHCTLHIVHSALRVVCHRRCFYIEYIGLAVWS